MITSWKKVHQNNQQRIMNKQSQNPSELNEPKELQSFELMDINADIIRGVYSVGFGEPSRIQRVAIPAMKTGRDMIAQSEAGSGKTAAYTIGMLDRINQGDNEVQAVVVVPVRELALAVCKFIKQVSEFTKLRVQTCVGGSLMKEQKSLISKLKPHIIVGTPGRILDHIEKRSFSSDHIKIVILDEADELLSKVFVEQIIEIFKSVPADAQSCTFSATYPPQALEITKNFMKDPIMLTLKPHEIPVGRISQFHVALDEESQKMPTLIQICKNLLIHHWIIFVKSNERANEVGKKLIGLGIPTTIIHSEIQDRTEALDSFKSGKTRILVSTDVMARGIDINSVSLVINYDMPHPRAALTQYMHRIGRCGRFGKAGVSISLVLPQDNELLGKIQKLYKVKIQDLPTDPKKIAPWLATD